GLHHLRRPSRGCFGRPRHRPSAEHLCQRQFARRLGLPSYGRDQQPRIRYSAHVYPGQRKTVPHAQPVPHRFYHAKNQTRPRPREQLMSTPSLTHDTEIAMAQLLLALADDELILAHRNSEWTGHGPILEEDIAFTNFALDEMGHAAT